eukprot:CAMPEP_0201665170 /NCGR_PEP_ID=MMETSP0494-20130426/6404_1 /ASSEMBLY_ACC=CAM_ASM_000839 /TAXON_ID=420259 /ORGANISM="Thalassiosira gravida, Strain GMp14c1" /LENGTH=637 /DNA_ID=CAMNT_0048144079 /DNA_START=511 /DNA_END=2424 /DNA_ORIENTATION=-
MFLLALNNTIVAAATRRSMRAAGTLTSTSTAALLNRQKLSSLAFSTTPTLLTRTRNSNNLRSFTPLSKTTRMMVSSSTTTDTEVTPQHEEQQPTSSSPLRATTATSSSLHTVMVHRNRQSAAFREGTPLIFGGSVGTTFTEHCLDDGGGTTTSSIPMGSLVAVVVDRNPPPKNKGNKRDSRGRRDTRGRRGGKPSSDKKVDVIAPHHNFNADDFETEHRGMIQQSQLIGYGVFNPESMYRVRILCHETMHPGLTKEIRSIRKDTQRGSSNCGKSDEENALQLILERKISDAIYTRLAMQLPSGDVTDTYRLINGEGDGLSGLAVDVLGGKAAIVMSSAAWCEIHKDTIVNVLEKCLGEHPLYNEGSADDLDIVWRNTPSRLKQDGYEVASDESSPDNDDESVDFVTNSVVVSTESSVKYLTYPYSDGQKTGFYADQRENRLMVAELCRDKRVLDLCCYNGGFALNAMIRGHAASAIGVDSSQDAVDASVANAELNGLAEKDISFVKDDISSFMKDVIEANEDEFDVIVLDPPKLAPSLSSLDKASRKYHALNRDAMNLINKTSGGLLLTCTCSAAMTQKDGGQYFLNIVNGAALSARRRVTLLRVSGAAPCHTQSPASFPAGAYLTAALFHVGPADK